MHNFEVGDIVWIRSEEDHIRYAIRHFSGILGPFEIRSIWNPDKDSLAKIAPPGGSVIDIPIFSYRLRYDAFMHSVKKAIENA